MRSGGMIIFCSECNCLFEEDDMVAVVVVPGEHNINETSYFHDSCIDEDNMFIKRRVLASELQREIVFGDKPVFNHICDCCGRAYQSDVRDSNYCQQSCNAKNSRKKGIKKDAAMLHL